MSLSVELLADGIESTGCTGRRGAMSLATEAVGYVMDHLDDFPLDAYRGELAEKVAQAAGDWFCGCITGGLWDSVERSINSDPRRS